MEEADAFLFLIRDIPDVLSLGGDNGKDGSAVSILSTSRAGRSSRKLSSWLSRFSSSIFTLVSCLHFGTPLWPGTSRSRSFASRLGFVTLKPVIVEGKPVETVEDVEPLDNRLRRDFPWFSTVVRNRENRMRAAWPLEISSSKAGSRATWSQSICGVDTWLTSWAWLWLVVDACNPTKAYSHL